MARIRYRHKPLSRLHMDLCIFKPFPACRRFVDAYEGDIAYFILFFHNAINSFLNLYKEISDCFVQIILKSFAANLLYVDNV